MSIEENKKVAVEWLTAFQTADVERLRELSHEEFQHVVWGDMPFARYRGFDDFLQHPLELGLDEYFMGPIRMDIGGVYGEGRRVFIESESFAPLKSGELYNNLYLWVIDVVDGKVRRVKELHDTLHTYRVLPSEHFRGPAQERVNVLFDEPTLVIGDGADADSALAMPKSGTPSPNA